MSDLLIKNSLDAGYPFEFGITNGAMDLTAGLDTAVRLSLFGGNFEDDGSPGAEPLQWWGNFLENEDALKLRSRTQYVLGGLPATDENLLVLDAAVKDDLDWFLTEKVASTVKSSVRVPGFDRVTIDVMIAAEGLEANFTFTQNWKASL